MNIENTEHGADFPTTGRRTAQRDFARVARTFARLPSHLESQIKAKPYASLGLALGVGVATGVLLGSHILRAVLASAASYAVIELGRAYLHQAASGPGAGAASAASSGS